MELWVMCPVCGMFRNKETNLLHLVGLLISTYLRRRTVKLTSSFYGLYHFACAHLHTSSQLWVMQQNLMT